MRGPEVVIVGDVGGTTISAGIVGRDGVVHAQRQVVTYERGTGDAVLENIVGLLEAVRGEAPNGAAIPGVGIGAPGNVNLAIGSFCMIWWRREGSRGGPAS